MSRFRSAGSYGHAIQRVGNDQFRISWTVDRYVAGSRLRFPTVTTRDTDQRGAERFAAKWGCNLPVNP